MAQHRQPLWLLPGFLCDEDLWRDQLTGLADLAECTVADLGHADSIAALARQVLDAAPPRFALAGFSFGGYVAQEIARHAPQRIARLALLDTSFRADTPERLAQRLAANRTVSLPGKFRGMTEQLLPSFVAPPRLHDATLAQRINAMTLRQGREVFIRQNAMRREDGEAALRGLACPVLVLCGRLDALTPPALHEAMAALMPQARLVVVENSGHMSPMEQPAAVTRAMRDWLTA
ncbi:alpha/beta hydrolase [Rhodanobacter thiooxydans]|uniref:Alpha/beta hydrolase n=1 Tax=Rhodanobacter thiooxydans TaxID=416169 RepID=A0A154QCF6_9GAMM|nr:alpha/beta fold hydrolase [Rhodanobacter thiooxydans]EIL98763.1 alpha/beta hydrolase fold protein [Rhodanobacter thiooxydans LCS2]KZC21885.1 alpha/beta hydrolase [Rhodanobacter thiooxydans]MCW0200239.1 alpha/beta hydrolase [Rhodanobacter thiooxydans]